jgi:hypothetical protein
VSKAVVTVAVLLILATFVRSVAAQAEIVAQVPDADYSFGQHITFYLEANSSAPITQVNLFLKIQGQSDVTVVPVPLEPGRQISVNYPHSLTGEPIPPFAFVTYWWTIEDESGRRQQSEEKLLYYADNRYDWQLIENRQQDIHWEVYWVKGDVTFGQTAMNIAVKALDDIRGELVTTAPGVIRIFIYPSEEDLRSALNLSGYDWAGGQARPELGAILVGIPDGVTAQGEMERLIPHELTHLLVYEATGRRSGLVPPWLNEGLASLYERRPDPSHKALIEQALAQGQLIPLDALCAPFPQDESTARLAYAQSVSVVRYLRDMRGSTAIRELLAAYADNASCNSGVTRVLGQSLKGLDSSWRASLTNQGQAFIILKDSSLWLALWLMTILLALPFVGVLRRRRPKTAMQER